MLSRSRRLVAIITLGIALSSTPAFAASRTDENPFLRRITQLVRYVKHLLPIGPADDPILPKP